MPEHMILWLTDDYLMSNVILIFSTRLPYFFCKWWHVCSYY